ncbi:YheU family protein [soil metagenome]
MIIPFAELQPSTLRALIEEFITRDGSVQGHTDTPHEQQIEAVMKQLKSGDAVIEFDPDDETCTISTNRKIGNG